MTTTGSRIGDLILFFVTSLYILVNARITIEAASKKFISASKFLFWISLEVVMFIAFIALTISAFVDIFPA